MTNHGAGRFALGELIEALKDNLRIHGDRVLPEGFARPHSYRGIYDELAFEPQRNITLSQMIIAAQSAMGTTFTGWKGGEFTMNESTPCWLSMEGEGSGETIGKTLLRLMLQVDTAFRIDWME